MIIQCKQCRTKFRFDDAQIVGDGLWMRCSRCQHVFFQDNPKKTTAAADIPEIKPVPPQKVASEKTANRLAFEPADVAAKKEIPDDDVAKFLHDVMAQEKTADDDIKQGPSSADSADAGLADMALSTEFENLDELHESREASDAVLQPPVRKKSGGRKVALVIWAILIILVVPAFISFVVFPPLGERYVRIVYQYIGAAEQQGGQSVAAQIKLQDIRQRVINNYILGNIRVVEGTAVNQADFSIARIVVKAQILDAYAVVLNERVSYAGNILNDEELVTMTEEEMAQRLSLPEGRNNSNDRLLPNERIPFMIVFTGESPGIIKTTVRIAGAERLL